MNIKIEKLDISKTFNKKIVNIKLTFLKTAYFNQLNQ